MTKRIFSVMIVLVMVVALAVPVFAATPETSSPVDEPIVERYVPMPCCGAPEGWETIRRDWINWSGGRTSYCRFGYSSCAGDYTAIKYLDTRCAACHNVESSEVLYTGYYCPVAGNYKYY